MGSMWRRRRDPYVIDVCAVNLAKMRRLGPDALLAIWAKLGASHPTRDNATRLVKNYAANLMAAKVAVRVHRGTLRRTTVAGYTRILGALKKDIHELQERRCVTPEGRMIHRYRRIG